MEKAVSFSAFPNTALATPSQLAPAWETTAQDEHGHCAQKGKGFISLHPSTGRCGCTPIVWIHVCVCTLMHYSLQNTHNFNFFALPGAFANQLHPWLTQAALCCAQRWAAGGRKEWESHLHPFICNQGASAASEEIHLYPLNSISACLQLRLGMNPIIGQQFTPVPPGSSATTRRCHRGSPMLSTDISYPSQGPSESHCASTNHTQRSFRFLGGLWEQLFMLQEF